MNPLFKMPASFWISAKKLVIGNFTYKVNRLILLVFFWNMFCVGDTVRLVRQAPIPFNPPPPPLPHPTAPQKNIT